MSYFVLVLMLGVLGAAYLYLPVYRIWLSLVFGLIYFIWGLFSHKKDLHFSVVLEYFVLALLGMSLLIFLSLRA